MDLSTKLSGQKLNLEQILVTKSVLYLFFFFLNKKNGYLNCILHMRENGSNVYHKKKRKREW